MAKLTVDYKIDTKDIAKALKNTEKAFEELNKAFGALDKSTAKVKRIKPKKWWQFWKILSTMK